MGTTIRAERLPRNIRIAQIMTKRSSRLNPRMLQPVLCIRQGL